LRQAGLDKTALGRDWLAAAQGALHTTLRVTAPHRKIGYFAPHGPDAGAAGTRPGARGSVCMRMSRPRAPMGSA
jgi:peptidoglycan LD-endopeptidase LytH